MSETRIPTHGLRFVEREIQSEENPSRPRRVKILQQMFLTSGGKQLWEDVPFTTD